jgi:hypothetical protein
MAPLPVAYMKAVRDITGFWGAYPLAQELSPGAYGRRVQGVFIGDGQLSDFPGYDAAAYAVAEAPVRSPADAWLSEGASVEQLAAAAGGPALPAAAGLRLRFSRAEQAAFACRNGRQWAFKNLRQVKDHLLWLHQQGQWDPRDILVTHVMKTDAAWLFYSSQSGQSVDLSLEVTPGPAAAAELLKAAVGSGKVEIGYGGLASSGYSSVIDGPATPLFQAIRIKRFPRAHADVVVRGPGDFDEATFGDPDETEGE